MKRSLLCMGLFSMLIWNNSAFGNVVCWEEVNTTTSPTTSAMAGLLGSDVTIKEVSTERQKINWGYGYGNSDGGYPIAISTSPSFYADYNESQAFIAYSNYTRYYYIYRTADGGTTTRHTYCIVANSSSGGSGSSSAAVNYIIKAS